MLDGFIVSTLASGLVVELAALLKSRRKPKATAAPVAELDAADDEESPGWEGSAPLAPDLSVLVPAPGASVALTSDQGAAAAGRPAATTPPAVQLQTVPAVRRRRREEDA